jgi:hypothetical protein
MAPWVVNILDDHGRIDITPRRLVCQNVKRGLARPFRWDRLLCGMGFADPCELVREMLAYFQRRFVALEVKDFRYRLERRSIEGRAYVEFWSAGHDDPEGMWRDDERMDELKEVRSLFGVPTFVEPIYNENPDPGCWRLWWDGCSVIGYQLLDLKLQRLLEDVGIEPNSFSYWMVECWDYCDEMGNDRRDKGCFIVKAWDSCREEVVPY